MRLQRWLHRAAVVSGRMRANFAPLIIRHGDVQIGQDHLAFGQFGHHALQQGDGGRGGGDPCRHDEPRRRRLAPPCRHAVDQLVAALCNIDPSDAAQMGGPVLRHRAEQRERALIMIGQFLGQAELAQLIDMLALYDQLIERARKLIGQTQSLGRAHAGAIHFHPPLYDAGDRKAAGERIYGWRYIRADRIQRQTERLAQIEITDRDHAGQQQARRGAAHEGIRYRPRGTIVGDQDHTAGQAAIAVGKPVQHPGGKRIGKATMRGDRVDGGLGPATHVPVCSRMAYP